MDDHALTGPDSGIRWAAWVFHTQLLPGAVPVSVHVMERFDSVRAARHERVRRAYCDALLRSVVVPVRCPGCGRDLVSALADSDTGGDGGGLGDDGAPAATLDPPVDAPRLLLPPHLPLVLMTHVVEALSGRRPLSQLTRLADPTVVRYVRVEAARTRGTAAPVLRTLHVQHDGSRVAEVCGLLRVAARGFAYCAQLSLVARGWQVSSFRLLRGRPADADRATRDLDQPAARRPTP